MSYLSQRVVKRRRRAGIGTAATPAPSAGGTTPFLRFMLPITPANQSLIAAVARNLRGAQQWTLDSAWAPHAQLIDYRRDNCCEGAAGCQTMYCNFQMWEAGVACNSQNLGAVLFQADRMVWAQEQLRQVLANPPDSTVNFTTLAGRYGDVLANDTRQGNQAIAANPRAWAEWCAEVMRLVGLIRWSTNMRWHFFGRPDAVTDDGRSLIALEKFYLLGMAFLAGAAKKVSSGETRMQPTVEYSDGTGLLAYCEEQHFRDGSVHRRPYYRFEDNLVIPTLLGVSDNVVGYDQVGSTYSRLDGECGVYNWKRNLPLRPVKVPESKADFEPVFLIDPSVGERGYGPPLIWPYPNQIGERPSGSVVDRLEHWFSRLAGETSIQHRFILPFDLQAQVARGTRAVWESDTYPATVIGNYPSPYAQVLYCALVAQDSVSFTFGEAIATGLKGWTQAYTELPEQFRSLTPEQARQMTGAITQRGIDEASMAFATAGGIATSIAAAINPIAGAVVAAVVALVGLLIQFAQDLCITRAASPPCLASPFLRFVNADSALEQGACDYESTDRGGATALAVKTNVIAALAASGITPNFWFNALDTLRNESPDVRGDGGGAAGVRAFQAAQQPFPWAPILGGSAVAITLALVLRKALR